MAPAHVRTDNIPIFPASGRGASQIRRSWRYAAAVAPGQSIECNLLDTDWNLSLSAGRILPHWHSNDPADIFPQSHGVHYVLAAFFGCTNVTSAPLANIECNELLKFMNGCRIEQVQDKRPIYNPCVEGSVKEFIWWVNYALNSIGRRQESASEGHSPPHT